MDVYTAKTHYIRNHFATKSILWIILLKRNIFGHKSREWVFRKEMIRHCVVAIPTKRSSLPLQNPNTGPILKGLEI